MPVQKRNVAMVYQQFINYPNFTVFENIASPLRVAGVPAAEIKVRVGEAAELLRLTPMLNRRPAELSGGQQQRTAIARALVKDSDLILLDEPLANLDYKLREELRDELPQLLRRARHAIVVYATTEPTEALLFGGNTATLHEGRITQFGPTAADLSQAGRPDHRRRSSPIRRSTPLRSRKRGGDILIGDAIQLPAGKVGGAVPDGDYTIGIRPHHITPRSSGTARAVVEGRVLIAELSGSESVVHFDFGGRTWVSQSHGIHPFEVGSIGAALCRHRPELLLRRRRTARSPGAPDG